MRFKVRSRTLSWLLTVIMVMSLFINVSPLAAAETFTGTIPPTWQNGTLNAADVTGNSFTLSRTGAQDDAGGTGYKIYKNNSVMTPVDDAYTYGVSGRGLQPATPYPFPVPALAAAGNESSAGPGISLATEGEILPLALVSAATDHLGKTVTLEFNRDMNDPAGKEGQFSVSVDGTAAAISAAALGSDSKQILLYLDKPIGYAATPRIITLGYTAGDVTAADGTALESFSEQSVANNIIKLELVDYEPAAAETAWEDDPAGGKILTYTLKDRMDYDNVNLAIYFSNGFFRNFADNLANYVRFYNKDTGEEVVLPNILTEPVPFTGSLPNRYMEYTDWYFEQISGRAPLGLALKSCALQPDTTYVVEVLKGFSFHNGPINNTYRFEFTTTLDSRYKPSWPQDAGLTTDISDTAVRLQWPEAEDNHGAAYTNGAVYDEDDVNYLYIPNLHYDIYQDNGLIGTADERTTTCDVTNLNPGTTYTFMVKAVDFAGNVSPALETTGLERGNNTYVWSVEAVDAAGNWSTAITGRSLSGQNPLSFIAAKSSLTTVNGDNSTDDGPIEGSTTVPVNPTIRLYFDRGVTTDAVWGNNQQCITLQDSTGKNVPVNVFRLGSTDTINDNLHYILIRPKSPLTAGKTYKIIISKNLTANNGRTLGENNGNKDEEVTFTVAAGSGSKGNGGGGGGGGGAVTTEGPTSTKGSASVDPAMGATVSLGDMARVVIPANALKGTGSVTVEIKKVTRPPAIPPGLKLAGEVYEFSVDGRTTYDFAKKVALTLQFNPSRIGANEVPAIYFYDGPSSEWINLGGTVSGSTITVAVDHFTKYAVFAVPKPADPVEAPPPAGTFNDIAGHWAQSKIEELVALGVVNGYPDGSFKPDGTITRAEFTTMLVKAFELSPQTGKVFADTSRHWARDYIATAEAYRLVSGYNAGTFGPDDLITREQTALMIVKAAGLTMISEETSFADNSAISGWAKDAVATAVANGLMKGYPDNIFRPLGSATRAEAVTVILSALNPAKN
jgi:uncharacterized repeat protein (TIGR02059 family)